MDEIALLFMPLLEEGLSIAVREVSSVLLGEEYMELSLGSNDSPGGRCIRRHSFLNENGESRFVSIVSESLLADLCLASLRL